MASVSTRSRYPSKKSGKPRMVRGSKRTRPKKGSNAAPEVHPNLFLMPVHDLDRTFLRVTNELEEHRGYKWHDGLNVDTLPFDKSVGCGPGGLYFTDINHLVDFLKDGVWVREVRPVVECGEFARVYNEKWKAHAVYAEPRRPLNSPATWAWLLCLNCGRLSTYKIMTLRRKAALTLGAEGVCAMIPLLPRGIDTYLNWKSMDDFLPTPGLERLESAMTEEQYGRYLKLVKGKKYGIFRRALRWLAKKV